MDYFERARKCLDENFRLANPDIQLRNYIYDLESARRGYDAARQAKIQAHPEAHLMYMASVNGAWFARWRAQIRGARTWRSQSEAFGRDFARFTKFYSEMREVDPWMK